MMPCDKDSAGFPGVVGREIVVLVVAADPGLLDELQSMLAQASTARYQLVPQPDVCEAMARLKLPGVDVAILELPSDLDQGLKDIQALRAASPTTPLVALASSDNEESLQRVAHAGVQDVLLRAACTTALLSRILQGAIARRASEVACQRAEEHYHSLFDHIVEGIFRTTPEGRYLDANPALARIYGYDSAEELVSRVENIGRSVYVDPGRRDEFIQLIEQSDVLTDFESPVYRKDGSVIWISENVRAIRDAAGRVACFEGTVEDITQRKLAEEGVRDSEALYHSLVETLPQNIFRKDLEERFTFANTRFCQTLGRPLNEILGKTDFDFFPPELASKYQQDDRRIIEQGGVFETVEEHQLPSGGVIYVQVVKTPLHDARGQTIGLQGIFWDITEKRIADERLKMANAELARSQAELRIKNEQMEEDIRMAREIQQAILPQQYPCFPRHCSTSESALQFHHRYTPSGQVGGDFFNVMALSDTTAGVFICDVMGHGVRSALITAMVRALVEELTPKAHEPGQLLTELNRDLRAILRQSRTPLFTTAFYLVVDLVTGRMSYANAGHPKQLLARRRNKEVLYLANQDGLPRPPLGLFAETIYPSSSFELAAGDLVLLHTDGLFEVEGKDQVFYSQAMLREDVERRLHLQGRDHLDDLLEEIRKFSRSGSFNDDVCVVAMEVIRMPA